MCVGSPPPSPEPQEPAISGQRVDPWQWPEKGERKRPHSPPHNVPKAYGASLWRGAGPVAFIIQKFGLRLQQLPYIVAPLVLMYLCYTFKLFVEYSPRRARPGRQWLTPRCFAVFVVRRALQQAQTPGLSAVSKFEMPPPVGSIRGRQCEGKKGSRSIGVRASQHFLSPSIEQPVTVGCGVRQPPIHSAVVFMASRAQARQVPPPCSPPPRPNGTPGRWRAHPATLYSIIVVFPLSFSLNAAYQRREQALQTLASIKASGLAVHLFGEVWTRSRAQCGTGMPYDYLTT